METGKEPEKGVLLYDDRADSSLHWSSRYALMNGVAWDTEQLIGLGEITPLEASLSVLKQNELLTVIRSNIVLQNLALRSKK